MITHDDGTHLFGYYECDYGKIPCRWNNKSGIYWDLVEPARQSSLDLIEYDGRKFSG